MELKRGLIAILVGVLILVNLVNIIVLTIKPMPGLKITAGATTGQAQICINHPPSITAIADQSGTVGTAFTLQADASDQDNHSLIYIDNTSLFDINQSGYISFTPASGDEGSHSILITVQDATPCSNNETDDDFTLTISAAGGGGGTPSGGGGGGGGGRVVPVNASLQLSEEGLEVYIVKVALNQDEKLERTITVTNNGKTDLSITIQNPLSKVLLISPLNFTLKSGQQQDLTFIFNPTLDATLGIYTGDVTLDGKITIIGRSNAGTITKHLVTVLEIESKTVAFDASIDLLKKTYLPNEDLASTITVFNLGTLPEAEVTLIYLIEDINGNILYQEQEVITLQQRASFSKIISLPPGITPGQYLLALKIQHDESFAAATELFTVEVPAPIAPPGLVGRAALLGQLPKDLFSKLLIGLITIGIIIFLIYLYKKLTQNKVIIVCGGPASGKTTFAKKLAEETKSKYVDVDKVIEGRVALNTEKLTKILLKIIEENNGKVILDGNMARHLPKKSIKKEYIVTCSPEELRKRLKEQRYSPKKIQSIIESDFAAKLKEEAEIESVKVKIVDTTPVTQK